MTASHVLPLVDISGMVSDNIEDRLAVARQIDQACAEAGFLYIAGTPLDDVPFETIVDRAKAYFALDYDTKMRSYIGQSENHSGYVPIGEEALGDSAGDLKEAFDVNCDYRLAHGRRPLLGPNQWPDMPGFQRDVGAYYRQVTAIGGLLFRAFALALGLEEDHFADCLKHPPSQLRLIHYPLNPAAQDRPGIGSHTDYECFTLLYATAPGLQIVDRAGQWVDVPLVENTMILNIGDMMEVMPKLNSAGGTRRERELVSI